MVRKVRVVPYDSKWKTKFQEEAIVIQAILCDELVEIHHIGSTSIPGISAKPVIDILPVVKDIERVDAYNPQFIKAGYEPKGEFGLPGRRYFSKGLDGERTHHIHAYQLGNPEIERHLAFRDYMISHSDDALAYSILKERLARQFPFDIEAYMDGKDAFIKERERLALAWMKCH